MRIFLIFLVLLALFATLWHALFKGSPLPYLQGAPQIEQRIHRAALDVMTEIGGYPVEIRTRGRDVVLTGPVESAEKRDQLVARIGALPLVRSLTNDLTVLDMAIPFTLEIVKAPDGAVAVRGHVPSRRVEDRLMAEARDAGGTAGATFELKLAAGAPEGDWWGMVSTGLRALSVLNHGRLAISGADAALSGEAPDAEAEARVAEVVDGAPMGNWMQDISAARPPGGFLFLVTMPPEGDLTVEGNAPDEATERRLLAMAAATTGRAASGSLHLANGMPGSDWPRLAMAGLTALAAAEAGTLELRDRQVRLQATVDTDADKAALEALMDEDWEAVINVRNPTPPGSVRITLGDGGKLVVTGVLPDGLSPEQVTAALAGADIAGVETLRRGRPSDWTGALEGLSIVLPRFETAEIAIVAETMALDGVLKRGFSAEGVHAALRSVVGRNWAIRLSAAERRPLAELMLSKLGDQIVLSGVLPVGLEPGEALAVVGEDAGGEGLAGGGEGDADAWRSALGTATAAMRAFATVTGTVARNRVALDGTLHPGYSPEEVRTWLAAQIPDGWDVDLAATGTAAGDGDRRVDLATGLGETYRNGFWLPDATFPVSAERCAAEIDAAMGGEQIRFVSGGAEIDEGGRKLLNRLSAVAIRCLNGTEMKLEVSGHTDSVGNDAENRALSERRALAVVEALARRGVRSSVLVAVGLGEDEPIASNDTPEGRARNRRIAFRWLGADE